MIWYVAILNGYEIDVGQDASLELLECHVADEQPLLQRRQRCGSHLLIMSSEHVKNEKMRHEFNKSIIMISTIHESEPTARLNLFAAHLAYYIHSHNPKQ